MASLHFDEIKQFVPVPSWMWRCHLPVVYNPVSHKNMPIVSTIPVTIANTATIPHRGIEGSDVFGNGRTVKYPHFTTINDLTVVFHEDNKYSITRYLYGWQGKIVHPVSKAYGVPSEYRLPIKLISYSETGSDLIEWDLIGAWPMLIGDYEYNSESNNLQVTCNFAILDNVPRYKGAA